MRATLIVPALLCALPCPAQDGWADYLKTWLAADSSSRRPWILIERKGDFPEGWQRRDEGMLRLSADSDLSREILDKPQAEALWKARGWSGSGHWLLLSRDGKFVAEGKTQPKGEDILAAIHGFGQRTRGEVREGFLREHPNHGDALDAEFLTGARLARMRYSALQDQGQATASNYQTRGSLNAAPEVKADTADAIFRDAAMALERLLDLPDGWRTGWFGGFRLVLNICNGNASPRMRSVLARLQDQVLEEWRRNPNSGGDFTNLDDNLDFRGFGFLWFVAETTLRRDLVPIFPNLDPTPGQTWPKGDLRIYLFEEADLSKDWKGLLTTLNSLATKPPEKPLTDTQWDEYRQMRGEIAGEALVAHAYLSDWSAARAALQDSRQWFGKNWKEAQSVLSGFFQDPSKPTEDKSGRIQLPADFYELLKRDPEPDLPNPHPIVPIRMVLLSPRGASQWKDLAKAAPLAPWGPEELRWDTATFMMEIEL
jgi:hypothetical protein